MQSKPQHNRSEELFAQAIELMPGGVNSPVRAFEEWVALRDSSGVLRRNDD